jgi:hypothetical protein
MLNGIITGGESWLYPESKHVSMQWKHPNSPVTKKFEVVPSVGKVLLTVSWDSEGVLLIHFQKPGGTISTTSCCAVLWTLKDTILGTHPGLLEEEYCSCMTIPDLLQHVQPKR